MNRHTPCGYHGNLEKVKKPEGKKTSFTRVCESGGACVVVPCHCGVSTVQLEAPPIHEKCQVPPGTRYINPGMGMKGFINFFPNILMKGYVNFLINFLIKHFSNFSNGVILQNYVYKYYKYYLSYPSKVVIIILLLYITLLSL